MGQQMKCEQSYGDEVKIDVFTFFSSTSDFLEYLCCCISTLKTMFLNYLKNLAHVAAK